MRAAFYILLTLLLIPVWVQAQNIPLGTWRTHFNYNNVQHVVNGGDRIYASANSGLFYYDLQDNSVNRIGVLDGLQGGTISALGYDGARDILLVGYASGNLDLVTDESIISLDLITDSQVIGSKKINDIYVEGDFAWLATDFGVLKLRTDEAEVRATYRQIGDGGQQLRVNSLAIYKDSLFVATPDGVLAGSIDPSVNLGDWRFWFQKPFPFPADEVRFLSVAGSRLFTVLDGAGIFVYENAWQDSGILPRASYSSLSGSGEALIVAGGEEVEARDAVTLAVTRTAQSSRIQQPEDAIIVDGTWWIADGRSGLLSDRDGEFDSFSPSGPASSEAFEMVFLEDSLWVLSGGYSQAVQPLNRNAGYYRFTDGEWTNHLGQGTTPEFRDITDAARMPGTGETFLSSAGYGLLRVGQGEIIDESTPGSPLVNSNPPGRGVIIPALESGNGGIWVLNFGVEESLHFLRSDDTWVSFRVPLSIARFALDIEQAGNLVWLRIAPSRGGGLVVYDFETGDARYLNQQADQGSLPSVRVNAMELDRDGFLWLGTDAGMAVITNPFTLSGNINAIEPVFDGRPLLIDESISEIVIDGGNRKWIGTENGAWLFNPAADELLIRFNEENSPLPADQVTAIGIHEKTGEVFFGTPQGIVSYRSDASVATATHEQVKIFPNPVRPDFQGTVGISGLVFGAEVKITDSAGRLVYRTESNGGTASWNIGSQHLQTGVYMVFSATPDGEETYVGKIAVIR